MARWIDITFQGITIPVFYKEDFSAIVVLSYNRLCTKFAPTPMNKTVQDCYFGKFLHIGIKITGIITDIQIFSQFGLKYASLISQLNERG